MSMTTHAVTRSRPLLIMAISRQQNKQWSSKNTTLSRPPIRAGDRTLASSELIVRRSIRISSALGSGKARDNLYSLTAIVRHFPDAKPEIAPVLIVTPQHEI